MDTVDSCEATPVAEQLDIVKKPNNRTREKLPAAKWFNFEVQQKDIQPLFGMAIRALISLIIIFPAFYLMISVAGMKEVGVSFISIILTYWFGVAKK